jgi:hypothetical protein
LTKAFPGGKTPPAPNGDGAPEKNQVIITERMIDEGLRQLHADSRFENDWEIVARIYGHMRAAEA